jgi:hypothetical protein
MLPNAVILILQETLEAALLIGVLLAVSTRVHDSKRWLPIALIWRLCCRDTSQPNGHYL